MRSHAQKYTEVLGLVALSKGDYYLVIKYDAPTDATIDQLVRFKLDIMQQVLDRVD